MAQTATESTTYNDLVKETQQQALSSLKQAQDFWLKTTELAVGLIPDDPTYGIDAKVPTAKEVIESSYGFYGKVFDAQKSYALKLAEILDTAGAKIKR